MTSKKLSAPFGVATSTASSKATSIKKLLKINYWCAEWCLSSQIADNSFYATPLRYALVDKRCNCLYGRYIPSTSVFTKIFLQMNLIYNAPLQENEYSAKYDVRDAQVFAIEEINTL